MPEIGKTLVVVGLGLLVLGVLLWSGVGRGWLGKLPGDILINRGQTTFYFPIVSCLLASVVLSALMWLLRR